MNLLLEKKHEHLRKNIQYEISVRDLTDAVRKFKNWQNENVEMQYPETGRVTDEKGSILYISPNHKIWDGEYWRDDSVTEIATLKNH